MTPKQITRREVSAQVTAQPKWPVTDQLPFLYANHFSITETEHEVVITFGNFVPTGVLTRSPEEINKYLSSATINPLAKVVMSKAGFEAFLNLLIKRGKDLEIIKEGEGGKV